MKAKIKAQSRKKKAHDAPQLFSKKRDGSPLMFLSHGVRSYIHKVCDCLTGGAHFISVHRSVLSIDN